MAYQTSTLRTRVQAKLDNTTFDATKILQFLNDGLRDIVIQGKPLIYMKETTYTTTIGATTLTTSATDILTHINIRVYSPVNFSQLLPYVEYQDVDLVYPNVTLIGTGPPIAWTIFGGTPITVNRADAVYTLFSKYLSVPVELVNDTDVPLLPVTFSEILVLAAYKRALEHDDNFDEAQVIQQQIDSKILDMNSILKPQLSTPHIMRQPNRRRRLGIR